jgi:aryl-alcohol dehydrogenase-like predicted oxidoreductase
VREEVVLATKVYGAMGDLGPANNNRGFSAYKVRKHLADSLRRLQTDRIDLYQIHHIDERVSAEEFWGTYERIVADGEVLYAGSSITRAGGWPSGRWRLGSVVSWASYPSRRSTTC